MGGAPTHMNETPVSTCLGCGALLQSEYDQLPGYVPKSAQGKKNTICQRCFRIKHYNEMSKVSLTDDDFRKILSGIGATDALVVKIVDVFDFHGSLIPGLHRHIGKNPLLLVGNKMDLLPKRINTQKLKHWMRLRAHEWGLRPAEIVLVSGLKGTNIEEMWEMIDYLRGKRDVYVVGTTNVGKSTVINRFIHEMRISSDVPLTTSRFPGTTLDRIEIPIDSTNSLYDTPGVINTEQITHYVSPQELKSILPAKTINPKVYQLTDGQTLFLGGFARMDFIKGSPQSFVVYISNEIPIHRTKLEKADSLYEAHAGALLSPPSKETLQQMPKLQKHFFSISSGEKQDIVISGLGWITVQGTQAKVEIQAPKGISVTLRPSII